MDVSILMQATENAAALSGDTRHAVVVKSTVVPGTAETVVRPILKASGKSFGLAVNREFLKEGHVLEDSLHPDRIVLGVDETDTAKRLRSLYTHLDCPIIDTDLRAAEAIKYATNTLLVMKAGIMKVARIRANSFAGRRHSPAGKPEFLRLSDSLR